MKTLEELKKVMDDKKDAILILGSNAIRNVLKNLTEEEQEILKENYTNKCFRRENKKFWEKFDKIFSDTEDGLTEIAILVDIMLREGLITKVFYQDIDSSYKEDERVFDVKGSINKFVCINNSCKKKYNKTDLPEDRICTECGKKIRPTFIFNGDKYSDEIEKELVDSLNETHTVILVGLDLEENYLVDLVASFSEKRYYEEANVEKKLKENIELTKEEKDSMNKTIVAIHDEDKEVNYNDYFRCDFQALGDMHESLDRFYNSIK